MASSDDTKFLPGGSRRLQFEAQQDCETTNELARYFDEIDGHVERHIGRVELIYDEAVPDVVPVNVMVVPANSDRRFHYLVTAGMSNQPMHLSKSITDAEEWSYAELVMALPGYWPITDEKAMQNPEWYYPVEHLKYLASFPELRNTWLSLGHSIPCKKGTTIGPNCDMTGFVLDYPMLGGESFTKMQTWDGNLVRFYAVYPVYCSEMDYKIKKEYTSLRSRFKERQIMEIFDPERENVVQSGWRKYLGL